MTNNYKHLLKRLAVQALRTVKEMDKAGVKPLSVVDKLKAGS